ncbi:MAG: von Willebrand factor type A domain-containing protein, partial [Elusimicrobiota bacterium]|nr:von Willebrand factor type A domain-containing protein [Elusimicrobiota bacterium]
MNEIKEAERFSLELDKILAGKAVAADLDPEMAADLAFAARLSAMDHSAESRMKNPTKLKIMAKAEEGRLRAMLLRMGVRPAVLAGAVMSILIAIVLMGPSGEKFSMIESDLSSSAGGGGLNLYRSSPNYRGVAALPGRGRGSYARKFGSLGVAGANDKSWQPAPIDREGYSHIEENAFKKPSDHPLSTFSIDVDAASYSNARRILNENRMPPEDAVRVEEFINYFRYEYPEPLGEHPFSITTELAACPWNAEHKLVRVGIKGKSIATKDLPPNNLVFLIDTSGSMTGHSLGLVKAGLKLLVAQMR